MESWAAVAGFLVSFVVGLPPWAATYGADLQACVCQLIPCLLLLALLLCPAPPTLPATLPACLPAVAGSFTTGATASIQTASRVPTTQLVELGQTFQILTAHDSGVIQVGGWGGGCVGWWVGGARVMFPC